MILIQQVGAPIAYAHSHDRNRDVHAFTHENKQQLSHVSETLKNYYRFVIYELF